MRSLGLFNTTLLTVLVILLPLMLVTVSLADQHMETKTTAEDVKKDVARTYETIKRYTIEQRDEALSAADKEIAELDQAIAELQVKMDKQWQSMNKATRQKSREALQTLNQKRTDLAEWYGGMRHSSKEAWEDVKKGFADSYGRLRAAFEEASEEFDRDQQKDKT